MKKFCKTWMIPALILALSGCGNSVGTGSETVVGEGRVKFECSAAKTVSSQRAGQKTLPEDALPATEDISLTITGGSEEETVFLEYAAMSEYDTPLLKEGDYKAVFQYGNPETDGDGKACFGGETDFAIVARTTVSQDITLTLTNSVLSLTTSEWFRNYYTEYTLTLRTESGFEKSYTGSPESPVESTEALFVKPENKIYFSGSAVKTNGKEVEFPRTEICVTKARTWHTLEIDAGEASEGTVKITLDDTMVQVPESEIELNPES